MSDQKAESTHPFPNERGRAVVQPRPAKVSLIQHLATVVAVATVLGVGLWWTAHRVSNLLSPGHAAEPGGARADSPWGHHFEELREDLASVGGKVNSPGLVHGDLRAADFDSSTPLPPEPTATLRARLQALSSLEPPAGGTTPGAKGSDGSSLQSGAPPASKSLVIVGEGNRGSADTELFGREGSTDQERSPYAIAEGSELLDRTRLLAAGSMIGCVLQSRLDSTLPGMTTCLVTRAVFSDDGSTTLIARGSLVTGEYRASAVLGQDRLYVLWKRLKTPAGVVINLESPATDPLGAAGMKGVVDEHWRDRIGAALLLSVVQDGLAYAASSGQSGGSGTTVVLPNTTQAGSTMASKVLEGTIGIAPTLTKMQGERVAILVARDLRFDFVSGDIHVSSSH